MEDRGDESEEMEKHEPSATSRDETTSTANGEREVSEEGAQFVQYLTYPTLQVNTDSDITIEDLSR